MTNPARDAMELWEIAASYVDTPYVHTHHMAQNFWADACEQVLALCRKPEGGEQWDNRRKV